MKTHYSAAELAGLRLPGIPATERGINSAAVKCAWTYREVKGRGGRSGTRKEYAATALPPPARQALIERQLTHVSSSPATTAGVLPAEPVPLTLAGLLMPQAAASLTDAQRTERDARKAVLAAIQRLQASTACSRAAAMHTLLTTARAGTLETTLDQQLRQARDPRGRAGDGYPSVRTLKRWLAAPDLAPKVSQQDMKVPPWAPALMKVWARPQQGSLVAALEVLQDQLPAGVAMPGYHQANRFLKKLGAVERQRGRMGSRELKTLRPFVRRDTAHLMPGDYYTGDGHTFDAEVAHPDHGRPFRPEMTSILDIATKKSVGWSAGLAESTWTVMDAQRHAFETHGICAGWYVDRGSGFRNAMQSDEVAGFAARVGFQIHHSLPYNSQARGVEERSHQSIWVRGAKTLPTYMGADMDPEAKHKVFKLTRAHIKATGTSPLLMTWDRFIAWCQATVDAYNARPHRSLPKIRDPHTGKPRHQSPNEAWQAAIDAGWEPTLLTDGERADLFRPQKICTVLRGEIRLRNNLYFSRELEEWHGEKVRVGYDIHNAERVWVRDMAGRLICLAEFEANKRAYFPQPVVEQDRQKRATARERRLETHLQEVRDELNPPALLEHQATVFVPMQMPAAMDPQPVASLDHVSDDTSSQAAGWAGQVISLPGTEQRPFFTNDPDQYRWLMRHPARWEADDAAWLLDYAASDDYAELAERYDFQGVAWSNDDDARARAKTEGFEVAAG